MRTQKICLFTAFALAGLLAFTVPAAAERPSDALAALHPDAYFIVNGPAELIVPADAEAPFIETAVDTRLDDRVVTSGSRLFGGDLIDDGALLNRGGSDALLRFADGQQVTLGPGYGVVVRPATAVAVDADPCSVCSVSCGEGYYSCCNRAGWFSCAKCTCVPNGTEKECDSGGPGSTSCSVGAASASPQALQLDIR